MSYEDRMLVDDQYEREPEVALRACKHCGRKGHPVLTEGNLWICYWCNAINRELR